MLDTIDPYIKLLYGEEEKKTKVMDDNENPEFNEEITFDVKDG
jgi:Ca2+-dependent lipid-binding protein